MANNIMDLLNKSIGDDGIKTDVKVTVSTETYFYFGLSIFAALSLFFIIYLLLRSSMPEPVKIVS